MIAIPEAPAPVQPPQAPHPVAAGITHAIRADTESVELTISQIKDALRYNREFFIQFYLGEELTTPVPAFHLDIFNEMVDMLVERLAEAVPRDFAKTTLAKLAVVYHLLFTPIRFAVYLSNTSPVAIAAVVDIMEFFQQPNHVAVFGEVEFIVERAGTGFYIFKIGDKVCILLALGRGKQVRGLNMQHQRPQLLVCDDLEDEETAGSEPQFKKCQAWLYQAVFRALDKRYNKVIHIGNIHGALSILQNHCDSQFWHARKYGCILEDGKPLWPQMWPLEKLRLDFLAYEEQGLTALWFAEMMNMPPVEGRRLIQASEITYLPAVKPRQYRYGFVTVDPARSKKTWADYMAVAVHVFNETYGIWQIAYVEAQRGVDEVDLFHQIMQIMRDWNFRVCAIEAYALQETLLVLFQQLLAIHQPHADVTFLPVTHGNSSKTSHISAFASLLKKTKNLPPTYALTHGDFQTTNQLLAFDPALKNNRDDVIDACAYGPIVTAHYMHEVRKVKNLPHTITVHTQDTYAVSPV